MRFRVWAVWALCALTAACATHPPARRFTHATPTPHGAPPARAVPAPVERDIPTSFANLPGWAEDDHVAAFAAFAASCDPGGSNPFGYGSYGQAGAVSPFGSVCRLARERGRTDDVDARRFFEAHFHPEAVAQTGLLTAYFMPVYPARTRPGGDFTAPVRARPADLSRNTRLAPGSYADRAAIERRPADDAMAWMRAEDLFFMQIQGSGVLVFEDGRRARTVFDGSNGAPFVGIAAPMRRAGILPDQRTSAGDIRGWLAAHRGPQADAVMDENPRYIFFRLGPDDGGEPPGAAGRPLIAGRAVAVDPSLHAMGEVLWIDASAPALSGAHASYRRLVIALDTGGAIKGDVRADLYMGRGDAAGLEAGRVRHSLRLYRLVPNP